ncbi:MAG: Rap1a/Tai family immunity protein [Pseudomonadota bacterium]|nr:Rap1a/Tai family immunity protein [Pseudomonadota bacterium]
MNIKGWTGIVGVAVLTAGGLVSGQLWAQTKLSDGYTLEDFDLRTAADLVDICTLDQSHPDHVAARAFCYGFFEGGAHYDNAISTSPTYNKIVCNPPEATRTEAVEVFVTYVRANPQYASKAPIDTIFRALVVKWPCEE